MKARMSMLIKGAVVVGMTTTCLGSVARGQTAGPVGESSALSLGQLILRESFDDNVKGSMWRVYAEDANRCWVAEINQRLELLAKPETTEVCAGYLSNGWWLDPAGDFSMKVDLYYSPVTNAGGWISLGVTPNATAPREQYVSMGIGCASRYAHYWYEKNDGSSVSSSHAPRSDSSATIYISYDASGDELYVSDAGYGREAAWTTFSDLVKGQWGGKPLFVLLGGGSDGLTIGPGQAFADNLFVESGTMMQTSVQEVYRFWSPKNERHFYTISKLEKETVIKEYPDVWTYEGVVYRAFQDDCDPARRPVHRFWSDKLFGHFYTISEEEKNKLIDKYSYIWAYEGVAFYAYPPEQPPTWAYPVHRFWSDSKSTHFYTIDEGEKDRLLSKYGNVWTYEGIAWYALE